MNQINPLKLFSLEYLFDPTPGQDFLYRWPALLFFVALFFSSWYVKTYISSLPNHKVAMEFLGKVPLRIREFAVAGLLITFFRDQDIPYWGMRFWFVLLFAVMLWYGYKVWKNYKDGIESRVKVVKEIAVIDKYLPKKKKRK